MDTLDTMLAGLASAPTPAALDALDEVKADAAGETEHRRHQTLLRSTQKTADFFACYSARTFTVLPLTLPAESFLIASRAMSRATAT